MGEEQRQQFRNRRQQTMHACFGMLGARDITILFESTNSNFILFLIYDIGKSSHRRLLFKMLERTTEEKWSRQSGI